MQVYSFAIISLFLSQFILSCYSLCFVTTIVTQLFMELDNVSQKCVQLPFSSALSKNDYKKKKVVFFFPPNLNEKFLLNYYEN